MLIAVPSDAPGGLDAAISDHFGHCAVFTLIQVDGDQVGEVTIIPGKEHSQGGCMAPVTMLKDNGVDALLSGGMGNNPRAGFEKVGIAVYFKEDATTVGQAIELFVAGKCREFGTEHTCGGGGGHDHGGGGCGGHGHHEEIERETVDGPIEKDRVVKISYEARETEGDEVDVSEGIAYLHGHGQIVPGLEKALEGHVAGDAFEVTVAPADAYGERDEARQIEVPVENLPAGLSAGDVVQARLPHGFMPLKIVSIGETKAILDTNHPMAGKTLVFEVKVIEVMAANEEDLTHGHAH